MNITRLDEIDSGCANGLQCSSAQATSIQSANVDENVIKGYLGIESEEN